MQDQESETTIGTGGWALVVGAFVVCFVVLRFLFHYQLFPSFAFALAIALIVLLILKRLALAVTRYEDAEESRKVRKIVPASSGGEGVTRISGVESPHASTVMAVPVRPETRPDPATPVPQRPSAVVTPLSRLEPAPILPPQPVVAPPPPEPPSTFVSAPEPETLDLPDVWARPPRATPPKAAPEPKAMPAAKVAAPAAKAAPAPKTAPAPKAAPATKTAPATKAAPKAPAEAPAKAKAVAMDKPMAGFKTKADLEAEAAAKLTAAKPKAAEPKPKAEPKPDPKPAAKAKAEPKAEAKPKVEPKPTVAAKPKAAPKPKAEKPAPAGLVRLSTPRGGKADDLKLIDGVGPALEKLVNSLGFFHFDQIAAWSAADVALVDAELKSFKGRVTRDKWVVQAKILAKGGTVEEAAAAARA